MLDIKKRACTVNGEIIIHSYHEILILNQVTRFYVIPNLEYEALIGTNLLNKVNAQLDFQTSILSYGNKKERMYFDNVEKLNNIKEENIDSLTESMMNKIKSIHDGIDTTLPFRTDIVAEIRTNNEKPVWSE